MCILIESYILTKKIIESYIIKNIWRRREIKNLEGCQNFGMAPKILTPYFQNLNTLSPPFHFSLATSLPFLFRNFQTPPPLHTRAQFHLFEIKNKTISNCKPSEFLTNSSSLQSTTHPSSRLHLEGKNPKACSNMLMYVFCVLLHETCDEWLKNMTTIWIGTLPEYAVVLLGYLVLKICLYIVYVDNLLTHMIIILLFLHTTKLNNLRDEGDFVAQIIIRSHKNYGDHKIVARILLRKGCEKRHCATKIFKLVAQKNNCATLYYSSR